MSNNEDIAYWRDILEQHRTNLRKQKKQQETFAMGEESLALLNQIEASEEAIREAKSKLRELGVEPEPSTIDPPEDRTFYSSWWEKKTKSAPGEEAPPVPGYTEDSIYKIEPVEQKIGLEKEINNNDTNFEQIAPLVFIGYAKEDGAKVQVIYNGLKQVGFKPWLDKEDILLGEEWKLKIMETLDKSDFFLICLSKNSITKRGYIQKEIRIALDMAEKIPQESIFLMPVRLEECEVPGSLAKYHWVDLFKPDGFNKLVEAIRTEWKRRHKKCNFQF